MDHTRPKNLNLFTIYFPLPAIVSFLHRASGCFLFLCIPFLLLGLQSSLTESGFANFQKWHGNFIINFIFWLLIIPFCFHLVAGIRHLLTDIQIGVTLRGGRFGAALTIIVTIILVILAGIWLW